MELLKGIERLVHQEKNYCLCITGMIEGVGCKIFSFPVALTIC